MKNLNSTYLKLIYLFSLLLLTSSCKKQNDWLDAKRLNSDVTPRTFSDYQAILDYNTSMNNRFVNLALISTDNLYVTDVNFSRLTAVERGAYLWQSTIWDGQSGSSLAEWDYQYSLIEYANIVLDGLSKLSDQTPGFNNVKGQALFYRAYGYYNLAQLFCKAFDKNTASSDLGLPLRLSSDVSVVYPRASLQHIYDQMLMDAKEAAELLDEAAPYTRRASRYAAYGLLAKIDLVMEDYINAGICADQALSRTNQLMDFNGGLVSLSTTYRFPVDTKNPEILFFAQSTSYTSLTAATSNTSFVDQSLIDSYNDNDLRKSFYYVKSGTAYKFRGSYTGDRGIFCGIAVNELYLIRSECYARQNKIVQAMADLNGLLLKRYKTGTFTNLSTSDADHALALILTERRKELPFTGVIRWEDLRRLNKDPRYQLTITRTVSGVTYSIAPNSPKYVLPIPTNEIQLSGITQNPQ